MDVEVTKAMREAAKAKAQVFKGQWSKYSSVANPRLGNQFLEEVCTFIIFFLMVVALLIPCCLFLIYIEFPFWYV